MLDINVGDAGQYYCAGDGQLSSASTNRSRLQAALVAIGLAGGGTLTIPPTAANEYYIDSYLTVGSNVTIRFTDQNTKISAKANCSGLMLKNNNFAAGNANITIDGGIWNGNGWNGDTQTQPYLSSGNCIFWFCKVSGLHFPNRVLARNSLVIGWLLTDITGLTAGEMRVEAAMTSTPQWQGGVQFSGRASSISIEKISGWSNDDLFALNADDVASNFPNSDTSYCGPITDVTVGEIQSEGALNTLRLLSAVSRIDNVNIGAISGSCLYLGVDISTFGIPGAGNLGAINLGGLDLFVVNTVHYTGSPDWAPFVLANYDCHVEQLTVGPITRSFNNTVPLIWNKGAGQIDTLIINGCSVSSGQPVKQLQNEGVIGRLEIHGTVDADFTVDYVGADGVPAETIVTYGYSAFGTAAAGKNGALTVGSGRSVTVSYLNPIVLQPVVDAPTLTGVSVGDFSIPIVSVQPVVSAPSLNAEQQGTFALPLVVCQPIITAPSLVGVSSGTAIRAPSGTPLVLRNLSGQPITLRFLM